MTLRDLLRRVKRGDIDMDECTIKILPDKSNSPFSSDK